MTDTANLPVRQPPRVGRRRQIMFALALLLGIVLLATCQSGGEPDPAGGPPMLRRLTEAQYRTTIAQIFGAEIAVPARFEKPLRVDGLIAVGTGISGMSPFAVEQYDAAAQAIATAALDPKRRARTVGCQPAKGRAFDDACARRFFAEKGRLLFRRKLTDSELAGHVALARNAAARLGSFYGGLELGLYRMLMAPDFLFRIERTIADDGDDGTPQLDAYSKAERLSFFLTNSAPDDELLRAAEDGDLDSASGVEDQVTRLIASPLFEGAVRAFFADMLQFERFKDLSKDPAIYPAFNSDVAADAQEQTLRTITEHLIEREGDYRDLFTTRDTHLTRALGVIYRTPVATRGDWEKVTFAKNAHRAGIQSHVSFLALHSHPGRSSPTLRGYGIRTVFLCQDVPDPPASVNFTAVEADAHKKNVTARDRIKRHATDSTCAGCHHVMDEPGLALENFDGLGGYRTRENGALVDASGSLDSGALRGSDALGEALRNHRETPRCLTERLYKSAVGRDITWGERPYLDWLNQGFEADDYRLPALMQRIATSRNFFAVKPVREQSVQIVRQSTRNDGAGL